MAEGEEENLYTLDLPDGKQLDSSRMFTGKGKATYNLPDQERAPDTYDGEFVEGFRLGWGTYVFGKNGDKYEGEYEQNQKHGLGKLTYSTRYGSDELDEEGAAPPRGGFYHGYFHKGKRGSPEQMHERQGETMKSEGTFTYCNNDTYVGQWRDGKKNGKGTYSFAADGTKLKGEWSEGKITNGQWLFPNGMFYTGRFRYNKPFGKGVWAFANGNQLTGEYKQEELTNDEEGGAPPPAEGDGEEAPPPDPKVKCSLAYGEAVVVRGGAPQMRLPKVKPEPEPAPPAAAEEENAGGG